MNWKLFATVFGAVLLALIGCSSSNTYSSTLANERGKAQAVRDAKSEEEEYQRGRDRIINPYLQRSIDLMQKVNESTANSSGQPQVTLEDVKQFQDDLDKKMEVELKEYDQKWKRDHPL